MKVYERINHSFDAYTNCIKHGMDEWRDKHLDTILKTVSDHLPSGSGIDCGTKFDLSRSVPNKKLVFTFSFHHMNENGYYDGWTEHSLTLTPTLCSVGIDLHISGKDRNQVKEYLYQTYQYALTRDIS